MTQDDDAVTVGRHLVLKWDGWEIDICPELIARMAKDIDDAIAAERERCAKIAESHVCGEPTMVDGNDDFIDEVHRSNETVLEIAAEIRSRTSAT